MNYPGLYSLLPSLFDLFDLMPSSGIWNYIIDYCWKECFYNLYNKVVKALPNNIRIKELLERKTKYAFGILDGYVLMFKFEEKLNSSNFNQLIKFCPELNIEKWKFCFDGLNNEGET